MFTNVFKAFYSTTWEHISATDIFVSGSVIPDSLSIVKIQASFQIIAHHHAQNEGIPSGVYRDMGPDRHMERHMRPTTRFPTDDRTSGE